MSRIAGSWGYGGYGDTLPIPLSVAVHSLSEAGFDAGCNDKLARHAVAEGRQRHVAPTRPEGRVQAQLGGVAGIWGYGEFTVTLYSPPCWSPAAWERYPSASSANRRQHSSIACPAGRCLAQASACAVESTWSS